MRVRLIVLVSVSILLLSLAVWNLRSKKDAPPEQSTAATLGPSPVTKPLLGKPDTASTNVYAHNVMLRRGPTFRVYLRWLRGNMVRTRPNVNPSFDDPESFLLEIKAGVVRANIGDIGVFLNAGGIGASPLTNITLLAEGENIKLKGTLHKGIALPVELLGSVSATNDNRIQLHVTRLSVLKIPVKGLLGRMNLTVSDLVHPKDIPGVEVAGNDIFFDTLKVLPPPHIRGQLTKVRVVTPDIEEVFGDAEDDATRVQEWRNFLRLTDGTINFGNLTMQPVDITMVDLSNDAWFDLDLNNYQDQLVNGYTRITAQAGLQIFMPDLDKVQAKGSRNMGLEWLKHRNLPPPPEVTPK